MNEVKKATNYEWRPQSGCFAGDDGLPEVLAIKRRAMENAASVLRHIPGSAFYPAGTVCKMGHLPVEYVLSVMLDGGDK